MQRSTSRLRSFRFPRLFLALMALIIVLLPFPAGAADDPVQPDLSVPAAMDCFDTLDVTLTIEGENITKSGPLVDLMIVFDESGSVSSIEYQQAKAAVLDMVEQLPVGPDGYAVGLSAFSTNGRLVTDLTTNPSTILGAITGMSQIIGWTNTYEGVLIAEDRLSNSPNAREVATKIIITITDGDWNRPVSNPDIVVPLLEDIQGRDGWFMFGVGIGNQINQTNILLLSSEPDSTYAYPVADFDDLADTLLEIVADIISPAGTDLSFAMTPGSDFEISGALASKGTLTFNTTALDWSLGSLATETVTISYSLEHLGGTGGLTPIHQTALLEWTEDGNPESESYADAEVDIQGCDTTPPETTATPSGTSGSAGWWRSPVTVSLDADDGPGSGVKQITYSATGANPIATTVVESDSTLFFLVSDGSTTVTFFAEDNAGNVEDPQTLLVEIDQTEPVLDLPDDFTVNASIPAGAVVSYAASANDATSGIDSFSCAPMSGDLFPNGSTTVDCTATDVAGNEATGSFEVMVLDASDQLQALIQYLADSDAPTGFKNSRGSQLNAAASSLSGDNINTTCNQLAAFIDSVQAQSGKQISVELADELITRAEQIRLALDC